MAAIRFLVLVVVILSASTEYFTRVNLSVALISMTSSEVTNATVYEVCPLPVDGANFGSTISENKNGARFAWNSKVKGIILGSYFYSYVLMQIPAGRMAELFGPKVVIATGLAGSAIINLLTPLLAHSVIC
ncbi:Sialin [Halotydeus destructor]|nr:Sialin [Halotydeus destructor]